MRNPSIIYLSYRIGNEPTFYTAVKGSVNSTTTYWKI